MLTGLDVTSLLLELRRRLGDLDNSSGGRYSDSALIGFLDAGNKRIVRDVLFPDCRIDIPTAANVQLYQVPLMLSVDRVYVNGQLITPSTTAILEGQPLNTWDTSGTGTIPSTYSDAPPNATGQSSPQWMIAEPLSYPTSEGQWVTPKPDAQQYAPGQPPRLYWKGGWIGIVPIPSNIGPNSTISIEGVRQPDTLTTSAFPSGQPVTLTSPANFFDAIVWAAASIAQHPNEGSRSSQQESLEEQYYERERKKQNLWRWMRQGEQRQTPQPQVLRPLYSRYRKVRAGGCR